MTPGGRSDATIVEVKNDVLARGRARGLRLQACRFHHMEWEERKQAYYHHHMEWEVLH